MSGSQGFLVRSYYNTIDQMLDAAGEYRRLLGLYNGVIDPHSTNPQARQTMARYYHNDLGEVVAAANYRRETFQSNFGVCQSVGEQLFVESCTDSNSLWELLVGNNDEEEQRKQAAKRRKQYRHLIKIALELDLDMVLPLDDMADYFDHLKPRPNGTQFVQQRVAAAAKRAAQRRGPEGEQLNIDFPDNDA